MIFEYNKFKISCSFIIFVLGGLIAPPTLSKSLNQNIKCGTSIGTRNFTAYTSNASSSNIITKERNNITVQGMIMKKSYDT